MAVIMSVIVMVEFYMTLQ